VKKNVPGKRRREMLGYEEQYKTNSEEKTKGEEAVIFWEIFEFDDFSVEEEGDKQKSVFMYHVINTHHIQSNRVCNKNSAFDCLKKRSLNAQNHAHCVYCPFKKETKLFMVCAEKYASSNDWAHEDCPGKIPNVRA
jgi:hypothetical protein